MTKKPHRHHQVSRRGVVWLRWKLVAPFLFSLCVISLLGIQYRSVTALRTLSVVVARSDSPIQKYSGENPKVAFLFLARRDLPLDFLWDRFFKIADKANFSIYIHSEPGFVFNVDTTMSQYFYNRQLNNSIKIIWGESSMIAAEKLLFASALEDHLNQRFVLLSDRCVPFYDFGYVYRYLISSPRSFVESYRHTNETRYNAKMSYVIPEEKWRKGSQWISLIRSHAEVIANDSIIFPVFKIFCKRSPPLGSQNIWLFLKMKRRNCIPDEHYVQTLLTMRGLESEIERRTLTYIVWNVTASKYETKSWHPVVITFENSGPEEIKEITNTKHVYYETESRTEWCKVDSKPVPCFLFARKFTNEAAMRLVNEGLIGSTTNITL